MNLSYHTWIANQSIISIQDIQTIKSIVGRYICKTYFDFRNIDQFLKTQNNLVMPEPNFQESA